LVSSSGPNQSLQHTYCTQWSQTKRASKLFQKYRSSVQRISKICTLHYLILCCACTHARAHTKSYVHEHMHAHTKSYAHMHTHARTQNHMKEASAKTLSIFSWIQLTLTYLGSETDCYLSNHYWSLNNKLWNLSDQYSKSQCISLFHRRYHHYSFIYRGSRHKLLKV
jgi:hypothetical protein